MNLDWQLIVVAACVIWAVAVLFAGGYRLFFKPISTGCGSGGCQNCPSNSPSSELMQLEIPAAKRTNNP